MFNDSNVTKRVPSIAQLVERRTVESVERDKSSLGRWFESGSKETFGCHIIFSQIKSRLVNYLNYRLLYDKEYMYI